MSMFEVCAKCGHVGRNNYVEKVFAVVAKDAKTAAKITRQLPRVKHHQKDAIRYVNEIDADRYWEIRNRNEEDPYFKCGSIQDQRRMCADITILPEPKAVEYGRGSYEESLRKRFYDGKKAIRNPKKYYRSAAYDERYSA